MVMYEDVSKRQVHQFTAALRGCRAMLLAVTAFSTCLPSFLCPYLKDLLTLGGFNLSDTVFGFCGLLF